MKVPALIFGILGALSALSLSIYANATGSLLSAIGYRPYGAELKALSVIIPIMCVVGAGIVWSAPGAGGAVLLACAAAIFYLTGLNFFSMATLLLLAGGGGFALAAGILDSPHEQRVRIIGRVPGWMLLVSGLLLLTRDLSVYTETGNWTPIALGQLWFDIDRSSLNLIQAVVQRHISPVLWDPVIVGLLYCWAFAVLLILGAIFLSVFRRRERRRF